MNKLVSKSDLKKIDLNSLKIPFVNDVVMWMLRIKEINTIYNKIGPRDGIEFIDAVFQELSIRYSVSEEELGFIPREGPFMTVSNHPFGILDGMILIKMIAERRPDFKVMANFLVKKIAPIQEFVFTVNPLEKNRADSVVGLRNTLQHLQAGHPVGIFPAGEVSTHQSETQVVEDREWTKTSLKLIQKAQVPIVPIFFQGTNSFSFHVLGKILPVLRTAALPSELLNKKGQTLPLRIGHPIPYKELAEFEDMRKMGRYLRTMVYGLGSALEVKKFFRSEVSALNKPEEIVAPAPQTELEKEIAGLKATECFLGTKKQFEIFLTPAQYIPHAMHELGRLREITFRDVGEGSNRKIDVDEFDLYYRHLFLWDKEGKQIAGAYRLGFGDQIIKQHGRRGFYTGSLFDLDKPLNPILEVSIELGRSFVAKDYQRRPMPLFILWQGILEALTKNPKFKYLIGPVSISNNYSQFSQELLIAFIKKYYYNEELAKHVRPKHHFSVSSNVDAEILLEKFDTNDVNKLDKYISEFEPNRFRVPILLKKYMKQNAQIIGFNVDPRFNNSLDGLMILDLERLPDSTLDNLRKKAYEQE